MLLINVLVKILVILVKIRMRKVEIMDPNEKFEVFFFLEV